MSEYTNTTSITTRMEVRATATAPVTGATLLEAAYGGTVHFHKVRGTGTLRRWPVLAPKTVERHQAETWKEMGVAEAAKQHHVSVATVRRALTALAFTEELEAMSKKARKALADEANANGEVTAAVRAEREAEQAAVKAAEEAAAAKAARKAAKAERESALTAEQVDRKAAKKARRAKERAKAAA